METSDTPEQGFCFTLDPLNGELHAAYTPAADGRILDLPILQQALQENGYASFHFFDNALATFVARARVAQAPLSMPIGKRHDAEFKIAIAEDKMAAHLTLVRAQGGQALALPAVLEALQRQGIVFGLLQEQIEAALAAGECEHLLIAAGCPAQAGSAGYFENLLLEKEQHLLQADENAIVHYSDLSHLMLVRQGDPLLRLFPALPGTDGTNILGQVAPAAAMPELAFAEASQGAMLDPNDANLLVAACAGQPVITRNGAVVNALLEVADIDLATGNVEFDGTIRIKGDIKAGMRLKASGDVIVLGMIEAAEIVAGGNVAVKGGIIGRPNPQPGAHALPPDTARISCGGSLQALFVESARIKAGDSIVVEAYARQCELFARNQIIVGKPGARNSHLAGGTAQATLLIKALNLGTPNGLKTLVQVGSDPYLVQEIAAKDAQFQHQLAELDQVQKLIAHFKQNPQKNVGGIGEKIETTRKQVAAALFVAIEEKAELVAKLELTQQARIEVSESMFEGVEIRIGKHVRQINDRLGACSAHLAEESIVFGPAGR
jgi:uncharacterized protein (DUF342 family)